LDKFLDNLAPSFLKYDTQGRVIRLDTFSKTLAPGCRLGYFVVNPLFWERLLRATEVETQTPSGWSQAIVYSVLHKWGINGYLEWLITLRGQYQIRRNWICDAIEENFEVRPAEPKNLLGAEGLAVYFKGSAGSNSQPVFSFVPPTGGMYIWARFYLAECPRFQTLQREAVTDPEKTFADELWSKMAENLVIASPPVALVMLIDMIGSIDSWLVLHPLARKWKDYNKDEGRGARDWKFSIGLLYHYCESWMISLISKNPY